MNDLFYLGFSSNGRLYKEGEPVEWSLGSIWGVKGGTVGSAITSPETIGCGFLQPCRDIFFTKNGKLIGTGFKNVGIDATEDIYFSVSIQCAGAAVSVNFEGSELNPYKFDLAGYLKGVAIKSEALCEKVFLGKLDVI